MKKYFGNEMELKGRSSMSSSKRSTIIVEQLRKQQMLEALSRGKRLDGRNFDSYRDLEIEIGIIDKA